MIRFEVTGATPEEFAENAMKAWGLLAIGLQSAMIGAKIATQVEVAVRDMAAQQPSAPEPIPTTVAQPTNGSESSSTASRVPSDKLDDLFVEEASAKPTKTAKNSSKGPKLDDLKTRLSEVIVAATERWDQKRANAYARKLLQRSGVEKLSALEPEKYDEFMIMSALYLSGDAAE